MKAYALLQILDLARWAPSGDNTQPWRFEIVDEHHFVIHGHDTREHCVYDLDGRPSQVSLGALIETAAIAASRHGLQLHATRRADRPEHQPTFDVTLEAAPGLQPSPLIECIPKRSVQRRPLRTGGLSRDAKTALQDSVDPGYQLIWLGTGRQRLRTANLLFANGGIRLTMPEAYEVHRQVIHWNVRFSDDRVPSQALGVDRLSAAAMRWGMQSWSRIEFLNRYLAGTVLPRIQMDWLPALRCAAHVVILADSPPRTIDDYVLAGRAVQRLWLTATHLNLHHQPEVTPLVFGRYVREGRAFTTREGLQKLAAQLTDELDELLDGRAHRAVWMGRVGMGPAVQSRSERLGLPALLRALPAREAANAQDRSH